MYGSESFGLDVGREQDTAIGAVLQRLVIMGVLAGQNPKIRRPAEQQIERLFGLGAAILQPDDIGVFGKLEQRVVTDIDGGTVGNVVEHDRPGSTVGQRAEMLR